MIIININDINANKNNNRLNNYTNMILLNVMINA